jgi:hypothetical protein
MYELRSYVVLANVIKLTQRESIRIQHHFIRFKKIQQTQSNKRDKHRVILTTNHHLITTQVFPLYIHQNAKGHPSSYFQCYVTVILHMK